MKSSSSTKTILKIINKFIGYPHIESWGARDLFAIATLELFIHLVKLAFWLLINYPLHKKESR